MATNDNERGHRVRFYWNDIDAALQMMKGTAGPYHATIEGNFPVIDCVNEPDRQRLEAAFPNRP